MTLPDRQDRQMLRQSQGLGWYSKLYYLIGTASSCFAVWAYTVRMVLYRLHTHRGNIDTGHTNTARHNTHAQTEK